MKNALNVGLVQILQTWQRFALQFVSLLLLDGLSEASLTSSIDGVVLTADGERAIVFVFTPLVQHVCDSIITVGTLSFQIPFSVVSVFFD